MQITEIYYKEDPSNFGGRIGNASVVINGEIKLTNIGVIPTRSGFFRIVYPGRKLAENSYDYFFFPVNQEAGIELADAIREHVRKYYEDKGYVISPKPETPEPGNRIKTFQGEIRDGNKT